MGRIVVSEFVTLDGVIEAPGHEIHRDGKNAWALRGSGPDQQRFKVEEIFEAEAILLGRVTYQIFALFWPTAPKDLGFADRMNTMPKYVVSKTLQDTTWENTTFLRGDVVGEVTALKERIDGEIVVMGSGDLVDALMQQGLIDEYRILVYPVVLGSGKRLFREGRDTSDLELVGTRAFSTGTVLLTYRPGGGASSEYEETFAWTEEQTRAWQAAQDTDRVLASVLFTDIVDSTARAAALGDTAWRRLLERHDEVARAEVERYRGRLVKTTGDGILATFDAPTRALRCAFALHGLARDLGIEIRAAIHTGEIEVLEDDVGGIGVHIAARVLAEAGDGRIVVTRTVRDLATGTDLGFSPIGSVVLRGVPGEWELFEASTT